jgi:hypothetical protein
MNRTPDPVEIISQGNWKDINEDLCNSFYERYKDELAEYDGFICCYPAAFAMLFEKFNKPIILQVPIRYEEPFGRDAWRWTRFNEFLIKGIDSRKIIPCANSLYDSKYAEAFLDRPFEHIPSLCLYTETMYKPILNKFLFITSGHLTIGHSDIVTLSDHFKGPHLWSDLCQFKGIIHFPYNASIMKIFEQYSANIPLFFPTKRFLKELHKGYPTQIMSQLSFNSIYQTPPESIIPFKGECDPNNYRDENSFEYWMQFSDFYDENNMPFIQYFDSIEDLFDLMQSVNLLEVSENMRIFNADKKYRVYASWNKILQSYF